MLYANSNGMGKGEVQVVGSDISPTPLVLLDAAYPHVFLIGFPQSSV
jgi:hypothetical protein